MKLGQSTMEEHANKFLELLRYVRYIRDDKVKIHHFLSGFPQSYKDKIEFDEPRTLKEAIRKAKYCYDQNKGKPDYHKAWKDKKTKNFDQRKKCFKPSNFQNQQRKPSQAVTNPGRMMGENPRDPKEPREPLQCWVCGGDHMLRNCPHRNGNVSQVHNIQGVETVGQGPFLESMQHYRKAR